MLGFNPGISFTDSRAKHGNDRGKQKCTGMTVFFFCHPRASVARPGDLLDSPVKPGNDE